jgi:hypothetical protein
LSTGIEVIALVVFVATALHNQVDAFFIGAESFHAGIVRRAFLGRLTFGPRASGNRHIFALIIYAKVCRAFVGIVAGDAYFGIAAIHHRGNRNSTGARKAGTLLLAYRYRAFKELWTVFVLDTAAFNLLDSACTFLTAVNGA